MISRPRTAQKSRPSDSFPSPSRGSRTVPARAERHADVRASARTRRSAPRCEGARQDSGRQCERLLLHLGTVEGDRPAHALVISNDNLCQPPIADLLRSVAIRLPDRRCVFRIPATSSAAGRLRKRVTRPDSRYRTRAYGTDDRLGRRSGQLAIRSAFEQHPRRIEWGDLPLPTRFYRFASSAAETVDKPIAIDPSIVFGRPIIARKGVSTLAIADRIDAGESP